MRDLAPALAVLESHDAASIVALSDELRDAWNKRQVFRTDTEARFSVLNDGAFPTDASKYWQCIREQTVMLDQLVQLSFDLRRNEVKRERIANALHANKNKDRLTIAEIEIERDETEWQRATMEQVARDRVREILMWSTLKAELNDGSFDTQNVNTHQTESLYAQLEQRRQSLTEHSGPSEILNVMGPMQTFTRIRNENEVARLTQAK